MEKIRDILLTIMVGITVIMIYLSILDFIGLKDIHKSLKEDPIKYEVH